MTGTRRGRERARVVVVLGAVRVGQRGDGRVQFALQPFAAGLKQGAQVLQLFALQLRLYFAALHTTEAAAQRHQHPGHQGEIDCRQRQQYPHHCTIHSHSILAAKLFKEKRALALVGST